MKTLWFVSSGPDNSHLWDCQVFQRLKDAKKYAKNLPLTPTGDNRPFKIKKIRYLESNIYGDCVQCTTCFTN